MSPKPAGGALRRAARLLALGVLLAGLLAMHTLGHSGGHSAEHASGLFANLGLSVGESSHAGHAGHAESADQARAGHAPDLLAGQVSWAPSLPVPRDSLNLVMFCVAVLTLAGLALVVIGALLGRDAWSAAGLQLWVASPPSRPPPLPALSLSQLSILRI